MNVYKCDACGDEYQPKPDGAGALQLAILPPRGGEAPQESGDDFLAKMLGHAKGGVREEAHKFDLCYECALSMALALKKQKADVRAGRRPS